MGRAFLFGLLAASPLSAQDTSRAPVIYLMTMGVGEDIAARFGHNAIWVHDIVARTDLIYNYGTFYDRDPNFVMHFIKGRPMYWLGVSDFIPTLNEYRARQRSVSVQELNLSPSQRMDIARRLAVNANPENREYPYDYYFDNCATRVRDLLDLILGGALKRATVGVPAAGTLRFHTQRSITNNLFMYFGILAAIGPSTDRPLDQWGEMFIPEKIQERVRELRVPGPGGVDIPLVKSEQTLLDINVFKAENAPPSWGFRFLAIGTLIGLLMLTGIKRGRAGMFGRGLARGWLVFSGVASLVLLFLWFATNHFVTAGNRNLLFLSPLAFPLLFQIQAIPGSTKGKASRLIWFAFAGSIGVGTLLALVPALGMQWNLQVVALVVPPSVAALVLSGGRRDGVGGLGGLPR